MLHKIKNMLAMLKKIVKYKANQTKNLLPIAPKIGVNSIQEYCGCCARCGACNQVNIVAIRRFLFLKVLKINNKMNWKQSVLFISLPMEKLLDFFKIWPIEQWISSLVGLVLMYWLTTHLYNKRLVNYNNEMSVMFRVWMILSDLLLNLGVGLYYLDYRETMMGMLMIKCPIAISPGIFVIELLIVIIVKEYEIFKSNKKKS